jgi:alanyl-tRNA synthetase
MENKMNLFEEIYRSCNKRNYVKRRITHKRIREEKLDFNVKDELINDLKVVMKKVIIEYKSMDITNDQIKDCIDEVCSVVKKNLDKGFFF